MHPEKKNEEIIDSYDYLTNAASTTDCTGLMPTPASTPYEREAYESIFHFRTIPMVPEDADEQE